MKVNQVYCGDSFEVLDTLESNSLEASVSDWPYGIGFMGLNYDQFTSKEYQEFCFEMGSKLLRVLKPGAYCVAQGLPKKSHRLACGLEDAGFHIKDKIEWTFGSGNPKNLDISKAIDKFFGIEVSQREIIKANPNFRESHINPTNNVPMHNPREIIGKRMRHGGGKAEEYMGLTQKPEIYITKPYTKEAEQWDDWGTGLSPAHETIILAQKPREGRYVDNLLKWGVGVLNIGGCRIPYNRKKEVDSRIYNNKTNFTRGTHKTATISYAPDGNNFPMYKPDKGRWPSNFILTHHPECILTGFKKVGSGKPKHNSEIQRKGIGNNGPFNKSSCGFDVNKGQGLGNFGEEIIESYLCHPDCPIKLIDFQSGITSTGDIKPYIQKGKGHIDYAIMGKIRNTYHKGDKGGASRYFYCGKVYPTERNAGCEDLFWEKINNKFKRISKKRFDTLPDNRKINGNIIKTLKPINLMRYLVRLVTPRGGTVLDPFAGSCTTGIACLIEGMNYILIEKRKKFAKLIGPRRLKYWSDPNHWKLLKDHPLLPEIQEKINEQLTKTRQIDLMNFMEV